MTLLSMQQLNDSMKQLKKDLLERADDLTFKEMECMMK